MNNAIAQTIMRQVGNGALAMLGAHGLLDTGKGLRFGIKGSRIANRVEVTLDGDDTYTVKITKHVPLKFNSRTGAMTGGTDKVVAEVSGVYADSVNRTIAAHTGLYTRL